MAERRMFAKTIVSSDAFLDMPQSTQVLYFHLGMRADDDGFVNSPKSIMRVVGCKEDDIKLLIAKKFILSFDDGVIVIKHWKIHNYIAKDRYNETKYKELLSQLYLDENNAYTFDSTAKAIEYDNGDKELSPARKKRAEAKKESDLPYSFEYKIRNAFIGMECPICHGIMESNEFSDKKMPSIQHNKPISKGGKHELGNISVVCRSCNSSTQDEETGKLNADIVSNIWRSISSPDASDENVSGMYTQVRLGKDRVGKVKKDKDIYGECENVLLSKDELEKLKAKFGVHWPLVLSEFSTGKEAKGYKYKNDYAALLRWDFSRILARPAPARGKHCPRCGSRPMGSEDYCTVCAEDSIAETDDVQHWVDDE